MAEVPGRGVAAPRPGRSCPADYGYGAAALRKVAPALQAETLYVAGGLYGNPQALEALLELAATEPGARLVFNGDFNWFDVDTEDFRAINTAVLGHFATRGNVETELAQPGQDAGCGCGYPDWVGDEDVARSNRIMERLRRTAAREPALQARLGALPMYAVALVGGERVAIVHGDADSLAGWGLSQESLAEEAGLDAARTGLAASTARVIASSHTCLPVMQSLRVAQGEVVLANNGAAGMPNFRGTRFGLATRISVHAPGAAQRALHGLCVAGLHVHAVPIAYDHATWESRFLAQWPPGSDAHLSYYARICDGPRYLQEQALRVATCGALA
ncbi:MAG: hypothetical protein IPK29_06260 [Betaproteobacteria bacterium]|nr:hypothetical protein [Betaproteobacteria bacterium]